MATLSAAIVAQAASIGLRLNEIRGLASASAGSVMPRAADFDTRGNQAARRNDAANAAVVSIAHLFGSPAPDPADLTDPARLPRSAAAVVLRGTLVSSGETGPLFGIFSVGDQKQQLVKQGDTFPDGSRLLRIEPFGAVLERAGVLEWLTMPRYEKPRETPKAARVAQAAALPRDTPQSAQARTEALSLMQLEIARDATGNPIGFIPRAGERWAGAGLLAGDVITAIDGVPAFRIAADRFAMTRIATQKKARFTLQRGEDVVTLPNMRLN